MPEFESIKHFTAGYARSNNNFVIQNLKEGSCSVDLLPAIYIVRNIIQRGNPTRPSRFLESELALDEGFTLLPSVPLISSKAANWHHTIRGDELKGFVPARLFFEEILPPGLGEFGFVHPLIVPEAPINWITMVDSEQYYDQQVDFYLPQAFLAIEIDGSQHEKEAEADAHRDRYLRDYGIQTVRISTHELEDGGDILDRKLNIIRTRIAKVIVSQKDRKMKDPATIVLSDYAAASVDTTTTDDIRLSVTAIMRFQILILELLERGVLCFGSNWKIAVRSPDGSYPIKLAIDDILQWLGHILRLQKVEMPVPTVELIDVEEWSDNTRLPGYIRVDFSLRERYGDSNSYDSELVSVMTDYYEHYRYFRKSNSRKLEFVDLRPYDYRTVSTADPVKYRLHLGAGQPDEQSLLYVAGNTLLRDVDQPVFNDGQISIIESCLAGNDTLGLLPTGGGKSLCFQLSALLQPCLTIIVVPIKALMKDQLVEFTQIGIDMVAAISSDDGPEEKEKLLKELSIGRYQFFYLSPERFQSKPFRESFCTALRSLRMAYAVIDEIHCLSEWGHDFRTSYLNLVRTIRMLTPDATLIGLTATASLNVLKDIQLDMDLSDENIKTVLNYTRDELEFGISSRNGTDLDDIEGLITDFDKKYSVSKPRGADSECIIVFTQTVNGESGCLAVATELARRLKVETGFYCGSEPRGGGWEPYASFEEYKSVIQDKYKKNDITLMVATKAFGMGVNKPNIIATIHAGMPSSMESFYQEGGRAGRDKRRYKDRKARCHLFFSPPGNDVDIVGVWDREKNIMDLREILQKRTKVDYDLSTNLFLIMNNLLDIELETDFILQVLQSLPKESERTILAGRNYEDPRSKTANNIESPVSRKNMASKQDLERAIYRLSQLGVISDWTVENHFGGGVFDVTYITHDLHSMNLALDNTMKKYPSSEPRDRSVNRETERGCIQSLLTWVYDYFVYNRIQSLKTIHDLCMNAIEGKFDSNDIKENLEKYFRFSESTYVLQHIAEHPWEYPRWIEILESFFPEDADSSTREVKLKSLRSSLSRFLESYRDNVGLNLLSGMVRLMLHQFEDSDGRPRMRAALSQISGLETDSRTPILEVVTEFSARLDRECKNQLALLFIEYFPYLDSMWLYKKLHDDESFFKVLEIGSIRLGKIEERLNG